MKTPSNKAGRKPGQHWQTPAHPFILEYIYEYIFIHLHSATSIYIHPLALQQNKRNCFKANPTFLHINATQIFQLLSQSTLEM